jgi:hypothetical protein
MNPRAQGLLAAIAVLAAHASVLANIYVPQGGGATLAPLRSEEIVMESERVLVEETSDPDEQSRASAVYRMRNDTDRTLVTRVAFPFRESYHDALAHGNFKVTVVDATGIESEPVCEQIRPHEVEPLPYNFGAAYVWSVTWAPRETKEIKVSYTIGRMDLPELFVDGWRLSYLVSTGAYWKGPIEEAEFTFRFAKYPPTERTLLDSVFPGERGPDFVHPGYSYPEHARRVSDTEIQWRFKDWIPAEDVWVGQIRWVGIDESYSLDGMVYADRDYRGNDVAYDDAYLEKKVNALLASQRDRFPEQTQSVHARLKVRYARVLYHEILARNGDGFYLGKKRPWRQRPPDAYAEYGDGSYLSIWHRQFELSARYNGRWYQPGNGKGRHGSVRLKDLTPLERANLAFLQQYFDPAEAHPAKKPYTP